MWALSISIRQGGFVGLGEGGDASAYWNEENTEVIVTVMAVNACLDLKKLIMPEDDLFQYVPSKVIHSYTFFLLGQRSSFRKLIFKKAATSLNLWLFNSNDSGGDGAVAEVDVRDKTIKSYCVRHHKFDSVTNHFRWFDIKAFDNENEMTELLEIMGKELEERRLRGESHPKEQVAGSIYDPERIVKNGLGWTAHRPLH